MQRELRQLVPPDCFDDTTANMMQPQGLVCLKVTEVADRSMRSNILEMTGDQGDVKRVS